VIKNLYLKTGDKFLWSTWQVLNGQDLLTQRFDVSLHEKIYAAYAIVTVARMDKAGERFSVVEIRPLLGL